MAVRSSIHSWGIVAVCLLAACDGGLPSAFSSPAHAPIPVHVETVSPAELRPALVVTGVVEAKFARTLAFRSSGRIARLHVETGARVAAGDVIAEFDRVQLAAERRSARTNLVRTQARRIEGARREGRQRRLLELAAVGSAPPASPSIESLLYEADLRYARALVERANSRLAAGVLRAPANGIIDRRYRGVGEVAIAGAPVVRLAELDSVAVRALLPRALRPLLRVDGTAGVSLNGEAAASLPGVIVSVGGGGAAATREVEFEVRVENSALALRPGMLVTITIEVAASDAPVAIPLAAVRRGIDARPFSFVVVGRNGQWRVERRRLVFGGFDGDRVAVVAGLAVGDRVVTHGQDLVTVGDAVGIVGEGL